MHCSNENLRHGHLSVRTLDHFLAALPVAPDIDLTIVYTLSLQQSLRGIAKGAVPGRVNLDGRHDVSSASSVFYMGLRAGATTRAKTSTSTWDAPARNNTRVQASTVAPDVSTSSTNIKIGRAHV